MNFVHAMMDSKREGKEGRRVDVDGDTVEVIKLVITHNYL